MTPSMVQNSTFAATVGGAITVLIAWALTQFAKIDIPGDVSSTFTVLVMALLTHFVPDAPVPPKVAV